MSGVYDLRNFMMGCTNGQFLFNNPIPSITSRKREGSVVLSPIEVVCVDINISTGVTGPGGENSG